MSGQRAAVGWCWFRTGRVTKFSRLQANTELLWQLLGKAAARPCLAVVAAASWLACVCVCLVEVPFKPVGKVGFNANITQHNPAGKSAWIELVLLAQGLADKLSP